MAEQGSYRALTAPEVQALEAGGSWAEDWSGVRVAEGFSPSAVRRCSFIGQVRLGAFGPAVAVPGGSLPSGVRDATLSNCTVGDGALVQGVGLLADYDVGDGACVLGCTRVSMDGESAFGNGVSIEVLNEGGGRELKLFERLSAQLAYLAVCYRHRPKLVAAIDRMAEEWAAKRRSARGSIGAGARVMGCGTVECVAVGPAAVVDGAVLLRNGTVCSSPDAPTTVGAGVSATDFIIGTGSVVDGGAMLSHCFVGQGCRIGRQFSAENSAFFANCEGFHGEAVAVLAGPYTVTHHKSTLLIAGMFSFYNAGSGTNQSNHMYKLGPLHQGVVERGSKTGSFSYLLWPARVGPFSVVLGKHYANFDVAQPAFQLRRRGGRPLRRQPRPQPLHRRHAPRRRQVAGPRPPRRAGPARPHQLPRPQPVDRRPAHGGPRRDHRTLRGRLARPDLRHLPRRLHPPPALPHSPQALRAGRQALPRRPARRPARRRGRPLRARRRRRAGGVGGPARPAGAEERGRGVLRRRRVRRSGRPGGRRGAPARHARRLRRLRVGLGRARRGARPPARRPPR